MKRRVERSPATMELVTFRREILLLRFASVEMTEGVGRLFYNLRPKGATTTLSGRAAVAP